MAVIVEVRLYMTLAYIGTTELKRKIKEIIRDITYTVNKQRPKKFRLAGKESGNCKVSAKKRETLVTVTWGWKP